MLFWDASGLVKRYVVEAGNDVVDALFAFVPTSAMLTTVWGYAETFSILLRKRNDGRLDSLTFHTAVTALRREVINSPAMGFLTVDESVVLAGLSLMARHNINATDAALLAALLRYARSEPSALSACVMVTSDKRLQRAAEAEGLQTINPQDMSVADVPNFFANW